MNSAAVLLMQADLVLAFGVRRLGESVGDDGCTALEQLEKAPGRVVA